MKNKLLGLLLAGTVLASASAAQAASTGVWAGVDFAPSAYYIYLGGLTAINGQDITTTDGWLARLDAGYGQYDYNTPAVVGGNVDGEISSGDIMFGYRHFFPNGNIAGFLGGDIQHHDQSPRDPTNGIDGSRGGVKGSIDLSVAPADHVEFKAAGQYSTAFDTYWSSTSVAYNFGSFALGPEFRALGNNEFHQIRFGAVLNQIDLGFANLALSGGYVDTTSSNRGNNGAYGGIGFSKMF